MSSDSADSHPPLSPVYTGPSAALQRGGPQPGAGGHVHLSASAPSAQGNCHLTSTQLTRLKRLLVFLHYYGGWHYFHINFFVSFLFSSLRFLTVTGLRSLRRAAAVDLRVTPPLHPCPHHLHLPPPPHHPAPLLQTSSPLHPALKMHLWSCTKVSWCSVWPFIWKSEWIVYLEVSVLHNLKSSTSIELAENKRESEQLCDTSLKSENHSLQTACTITQVTFIDSRKHTYFHSTLRW